ncbi:hypothetical protein EDD16DRAFT_1605250, partial [Pisolithus croceorrhizus]
MSKLVSVSLLFIVHALRLIQSTQRVPLRGGELQHMKVPCRRQETKRPLRPLCPMWTEGIFNGQNKKKLRGTG